MYSPEVSLRKLYWVTLFCVAMGYLESAVVIYLRMIYYPEGFHFPLKLMSGAALYIEIGREFATVVMLAAIGWLSGKNLTERILYFFYCFGIWDIFYYVWLKVTLNWPASMLDDDILFLIPVPWVGPVLAPVIVSITFIAAALWWFRYGKAKRVFQSTRLLQTSILSGLIIIFISFIWDTFTTDLLKDPDPGFPWALFLVGEAVLIAGLIYAHRVNIQRYSDQQAT